MNYKEKYFKYKTKYLSLKKQFGGDPFHFSVYREHYILSPPGLKYNILSTDTL